MDNNNNISFNSSINKNNNNALFEKKKNSDSSHNSTNNNNEDYKVINHKPILQINLCEMIKVMIKQYDFFLQLLIQNIFLTNDQNVKLRCYNMLYSFYMARTKIINMFRLPHCDISFQFQRVCIFNYNKNIN
jgi:hypothetical protein